MEIEQVKVCIFDVNGVLIDSNLANAQAMGEAFTEDVGLRNKIAKYYLTLTGIDRGTKIRLVQENIIGRSFGEGEFERRWERLEELTALSMTQAPLKRGCKEILGVLGKQGITRVALSNTPLVELEKILRAQDLDSHLDIIRGGGDWPKTESLSRLLREFQFEPEKCINVGDGKGDLMAAREAGVPFFAIDPDTGEFDGEDRFSGPYKNLAQWGEKVFRIKYKM